jgi:hypothetical protein
MDFTDEERAEIAAQQEENAAFLQDQADKLAANGNPTAVMVRRAAQMARDLAKAARTSNAALARLY